LATATPAIANQKGSAGLIFGPEFAMINKQFFVKKRYIMPLQWHLIADFGFVQLQQL
jgi:hypothetical protein